MSGEREAAQKKQVKAEKKQQRDAVRKVAGTSKSIKKSKKGGIRIRKGVTIKVSATRCYRHAIHCAAASDS